MNEIIKSEERKIVVVVDVCSSTKIMWKLNEAERLLEWAKVIKDLDCYLIKEREKLRFEIYKFIGDGWILMFDPHSELIADLIPFLRRLSDTYRAAYKKRIRNLMSIRIDYGLAFGMDVGTLMLLELNGEREYVGKAINLASRLQGAIKTEKEPNPQGKVLMSKTLFEDIRSGIPKDDYKVRQVPRALKNITPEGEDYWGVKLYLYEREDEPALANGSETLLSV